MRIKPEDLAAKLLAFVDEFTWEGKQFI